MAPLKGHLSHYLFTPPAFHISQQPHIVLACSGGGVTAGLCAIPLTAWVIAFVLENHKAGQSLREWSPAYLSPVTSLTGDFLKVSADNAGVSSDLSVL